MPKLPLRCRPLALSWLLLFGPALAATAPDALVARVRAGEQVELIVEYDAKAVEQEAARRRRQLPRPVDDDEILGYRATQYALLKRGVDGALAHPDIEAVADYSHLPMAVKRVRSPAGLKALLAAPGIAAVFENGRARRVLAQSLPLINQPPVAAAGVTGGGTTVAVIDDGIDYTNAAFGSCTAPGQPASCRVAVSQLVGAATGSTDNSHGTNVSAIVLGVAPASRIAMLDGFSGNSASFSDIIAGINWAIGNRTAYNIVAINMSLGDGSHHTSPCGSGSTFYTPVTNARNAGISVVAAAGNDTYTNGMGQPACTAGVISVGAVYDSNIGTAAWSVCTDSTTAADKVTCFSDSASFLTLLAPGSIITAAGISESGTSQASPHVAGAVAVLRAAFPAETLAQTQARLVNTGVAVTDSRNGITKPRLNLLAAARPANDAFANRVALSGSSGAAAGSNLLATKEAGEPNHAGNVGGDSVWWKWTAPAAGQVTLTTDGSGFDTLLGVYRGGSVGSLTTVAANDDDGSAGGASGLLFEAVAGTEYEIAVDGKNGAAGATTLNWSLNTAAQANLSIGLVGPSGGLDGTTVTYSVGVGNAGPQTATNVLVTVTLPAGAGFVSWPAGCSAAGATLNCSAPSLASGATLPLSIQVAWTAGSAGATVSASVASDLPDPAAADNTASIQGSTGGAGGGDVPTLPQWALIVLATIMVLAATRRRYSE